MAQALSIRPHRLPWRPPEQRGAGPPIGNPLYHMADPSAGVRDLAATAAATSSPIVRAVVAGAAAAAKFARCHGNLADFVFSIALTPSSVTSVLVDVSANRDALIRDLRVGQGGVG